MSDERLIPPTMLYRFAIPCKQVDEQWNNKSGVELDEAYRVPSMSHLDGKPAFAEIRIGWNEAGLFFQVDVEKKQQSLWCRETQLMDSDGFQVWVDTRNTQNVHRATRYCHWFLFLPTGGGSKRESAHATMLRINRSKDDPKTLNQVQPKIVAKQKLGGYTMKILIPKMAMDGWNPEEHPKLGFNYAVIDRELGNQTLSVGTEFPVAEDPSLWQTLVLKTA